VTGEQTNCLPVFYWYCKLSLSLVKASLERNRESLAYISNHKYVPMMEQVRLQELPIPRHTLICAVLLVDCLLSQCKVPNSLLRHAQLSRRRQKEQIETLANDGMSLTRRSYQSRGCNISCCVRLQIVVIIAETRVTSLRFAA
jgi:hypothetical protein